MSDKVLLLVPEAPAPESAVTVPKAGPLSSGSLRIGFLDNGKGNADHLLRFVAEGLKTGLDIASMLSLRKQSVSLAAGETIINRFAGETDLVITAMAD